MSWKLQNKSAEFGGPNHSLLVQLDSLSPHFGSAIEIYENRRPHADRFRAILFPQDGALPVPKQGLTLSDVFHRKSDLVATWQQVPPWTFGYQVDLRIVESQDPELFLLDLWLSVQTDLLESHPQIQFVLKSPTGWEKAGRSQILDASHRLLCVVHPSDIEDCHWELADAPSGESRLVVFNRFMEKGVIRRARVRIASSSAARTQQQWQSTVESFAGSPLPLTA